MKTSQLAIHTLKETPNDAEVISHQLMLRAGLISRVSAGIYNWSPLGLKVLKKVENIVREEMDCSGALEILMPFTQPSELWIESGRWSQFGDELLRFKDRNDRDYCLGPTHEEIVTDFVRREIKSYKQLPINYYQIQWKFRDERRPRFGVMRSREFLMKDAYSFHSSKESLEKTYQLMRQTYSKILDRLQLRYRVVLADSGSIGGSCSEEFHVLANSGEDILACSNHSEYAANIEMAEAILIEKRQEPTQPLAKVHTPNIKTVEEVSNSLGIDLDKIVKTLILNVQPINPKEKSTFIAFCLRADHELNDVKASKVLKKLGFDANIVFANEAQIQALGLDIGSIGLINLSQTHNIQVIIDRSVSVMSDFACGANEKDYHLTGVNFDRDLPTPNIEDLRSVRQGDPSPCGSGSLEIMHGIEVGHVFQLGNKYSSAMNACVLNENGKSEAIEMGCYGMGISRIVAASIEQNHDENGIIWPEAIAPFYVSIIPINYEKSDSVRTTADQIYSDLKKLGIDSLLEDRSIRMGAALKDYELIGIPHCIIIGDRSLESNEVEYRNRKEKTTQMMTVDNIVSFIQTIFNKAVK